MNPTQFQPFSATARIPYAVAVLALAGSLAVSAGETGTPGAPGAAAGPVRVAVTAVQPREVSGGFELDGVLEPVRESIVSAQAQGRIASLGVKAGDRVRAGQLLAVIDDREAQTGVARSSAQVAEADAQLRNALSTYERNRDLRAQNFISQAAVDAAQAQLKAAQAARDQAAAVARQSSLAQGFTRVTAPFDGVVRETLAQAGELAVPGKPIAIVYAPQPLRAVVQVGASRLQTARAATRVEVGVAQGDGAPRWMAPASRQALSAADPVSQTVEWRLELAGADSASLVPGQQVRVRFSGAAATGTQTAGLSVPREAILRRGELTAVYVAGEHGFVLKAVRLGADQGAQGVQVLTGLRAGDRVALDPVRAGLAGAQVEQP